MRDLGWQDRVLLLATLVILPEAMTSNCGTAKIVSSGFNVVGKLVSVFDGFV